ncbi:hypothetical protein M0R45_024488 [Rubus argutus]|uniref:Disease resistance protein At4g27190-like leucine-rich repeats domain-containing protein n=1 Tax=Rubus argutus TaxID=59490 RepID=A0AAW1WSM3_RUBAR
MRNSFYGWQGTEGAFLDTSNNASISELKKLSKLTTLEIRIWDADILPPDLFSDILLERYQLIVGDHYDTSEWECMYETTLNILKLMPTTSSELDGGFKMLLEKCDVLCLDGTYEFDFANIINMKEVMSNLTSLSVHRCDGLKCLFSSSVAQNFKKLKHLEVSYCEIMEQIISTGEHDEEHYMLGELKTLKLTSLSNLARFCTGKCIEFPLLEELIIEDCPELGAFVGGPMTKSTRKLETGERDSEENFDVHIDGTSSRYFLFDEKVRFPRLERLHFNGVNDFMFRENIKDSGFELEAAAREARPGRCRSGLVLGARGHVVVDGEMGSSSRVWARVVRI